MNDAAVFDLARRAGIAVEWTDHVDRPHCVSLDSIRHILSALGLGCRTADEIACSRKALNDRTLPPLITATVGQPVRLRLEDDVPPQVRLVHEDGRVVDLRAERTAHGVALPGIETPGYHQIELGAKHVTLAVAPARCVTISDLAPGERVWGLAAQVYGLRSRGDCGIGDMAGVIALAKTAAGLQADALALSPTHALFAADPTHCSPYSPSTRLFYNPLHADPGAIFGVAAVAKARKDAAVEAEAGELEQARLIDWRRSSWTKMKIFRRLFDDFFANDLFANPPTALATDFTQFRATHGSSLTEHAVFEALHAARLKTDASDWNWRDWPTDWRDLHSAAVRRFAEDNKVEILFHIFLQWIADRSLSTAQRQATGAGMRVGLIADLAVGMNSGGSGAWSGQNDVLGGLQIGAPPDLFNAAGQNWGLTTLSPRALSIHGFAPFIAMLRACMRRAGGVRIDHAMGLMRLWVVPQGAKASEGAYLAYPLTDLLRLTALESHRHRAIVIGEDLGTVPAGFRDRLAANGIYGMGVLWFERDRAGFAPPHTWASDAAAMTSTHDLPTVAGWWRGRDLEVRAQGGFISDLEEEQAARKKDRNALWKACSAAQATRNDAPSPDQSTPVVDAVVKFIAQTPSHLALLPLEDALALEDQPNLPGTIDEQPNWRRRYQGEAGTLLDPPAVAARLGALGERKDQ
jgi:4-alpha-glucanotransferase